MKEDTRTNATKWLTKKVGEYLIAIMTFNILFIGILTIYAWIRVQYYDQTVYMAGRSWAVDTCKIDIDKKR